MITRTIRTLAFVSLFTDMASEMLYPVMPVFLKSIGFSFLLIGILEGLAEATAGLSKTYFGRMSDSMAKRLPFVQIGYALSAISKPMMAAFIAPLWIFFARTADRLGKGIRTGARDAILSDESTAQNKGKVFGFHRSMDTLGAVFGPAIALCWLYYHPGDYKALFMLAFLPGLFAIALTFIIKEKKLEHRSRKKRPGFLQSFSYWKNSNTQYRQLVTAFLLFAVFNSSDVFLLLKMKESGLSDTAVIAVYIFYNMVFAIFAWPIGILADRIGLRNIFITGILAFTVVYFGFALSENLYVFLGLFALYGIYAAATEGISKAWISNIVRKEDTATAIGMFSGFQSICALIASSLTGFLWWQFGSFTTFIVTASVSVVVAIYLFNTQPSRISHEIAKESPTA